eukprot:CAMPEP_0115221408 /NCGR_PEP_ID=MMETSP0270-20121206/27951_1 /TAXON_ID=71861 /ORGANISM="Scrippsiella trochoidea, Strain CCMP3099" /LENGTH=42 /DNA_ID= /DNA_START= /DNA_END= /DNA_ORIENTATION=
MPVPADAEEAAQLREAMLFHVPLEQVLGWDASPRLVEVVEVI